MARVICPFCLKPHNFEASSLTCETHSEEMVPNIYVKDYNKVPPLWLVTVGFSRHGKTTYLAALAMMLENISKVWNQVYYRPLDQYTFEAIRQMRREAIHGELPPKTAREKSRPLLFNVYDLPESGSRCLVMYDVAGEVYNSLSEVEHYVPFLKQVSTTWFLVSLTDLKEDVEGKKLPDLFHSYLTGMENLRIDLKGRNLIVVYTKGDTLLSKEFREYLMEDPFQGVTLPEAEIMDSESFSFQNYIEKMKRVSTIFEEYTRKKVEGGSAFISMVKASGMNLVFSVTSALGQDPTTPDRLSVNARRYRVLDPFLWAITLESREVLRSICLVADTSPTGGSIYDDGILGNIWERLSDYGEVTTYYLGQTSPVSKAGQRAPDTPARVTRQRLIGPLLEKASPKTCFIVLSTGRIIDLRDFYNSSWRDRLLLVMVGEDEQQDWPNTVVYRPGDDVSVIVDALLRLYE